MSKVFDSSLFLSRLHRDVFAVSILGLFSCLLISWRVWIPADNFYPTLPIIELFELYQPAYQWVYLISFFLGLVFILFLKNRWVNPIGLILVVLYIFGDYNRIQPWFYYFLLVILILKVWSQQRVFEKTGAICLLLSTVYIFSGMQKVHGNFALSTFPWLIEPLTIHLNESNGEFLNRLWWLAPLIETSAGVGLLVTKYRKLSAVLLIGMHVFILAFLGPIGHNSNAVVWPWNLGFIALLYFFFIKSDRNYVEFFFPFWNSRVKLIYFTLIGILPILSFIDLWPKHLSGSLYTGNKIRSEIIIPDELLSQLPDRVDPIQNGIEYSLFTNLWTIQELNVAMNPSKKTHLTLYKKLCTEHPEHSDFFVFQLLEEPHIFTGERNKITYFCSDLQ